MKKKEDEGSTGQFLKSDLVTFFFFFFSMVFKISRLMRTHLRAFLRKHLVERESAAATIILIT